MTTLAEPAVSAPGRRRVPAPPAAGTSFIGRSEQLAELSSLLTTERLLTLVGPPGVGKSRLALEFARARATDYSDGAVLVDLVPVGRPADLASRLAARLGVPEVADAHLAESLCAHLSRRRLLLVLDNCEHVLDACGELLGCLLEAAPELSVLATSREPLSIADERAWTVPALPTPAHDEDAEPEALAQYPAVSLFVERASGVRPGFALGPHVAAAVAEISRRLDGLPLALELAAAGVEYLTPAEIAARLADRSRLLSTGGVDGLARHRTLQSALDWSYHLLPRAERALLARLSSFTGEFCIEDVEGACAGAGLARADVPALFDRLLAKSLVAPVAAPGGDPHYRLLETIRAYAGERLEEAGQVASQRERHALYYLDLAERAKAELAGPRQEQWFERLDSERANLRSAIDWSVGHGEIERALRVGCALVLFWRVCCYFSEGRDCLRTALSASGEATSGLQAEALWGEGFLTFMAGDRVGAAAPLERSLELFRELGDRRGIGRALLILANQRQLDHDPGVLDMLEGSAALAREVDDHWCLAHALGVAGFEHNRLVELAAARSKFEECLRVAREAGDLQGLRIGLIGLGAVAERQGDHEVAEDALGEALEMTRGLGESYAHAIALRELAELALVRGQYARARELAGDALAALSGISPPSNHMSVLSVLGQVAHAEGDLAQARAYFEEAEAKVSGLGSVPMISVWLADVLVSEGDFTGARQLLERAAERARSTGEGWILASALYRLAELPRTNGDAARASRLHREALERWIQAGIAPEIVSSVEAIGALATRGDRPQLGVRLLAAAQAIRAQRRWVAMPIQANRSREAIEVGRTRLARDEFEAAYSEGTTLSLEESVALARRRRSPLARSASGWESLTESERQVAALVAESLTNAQIADALYVSLGTVKAHLSHMYAKLGIAGRLELAREFRRHEHGAVATCTTQTLAATADVVAARLH